MSSTRLLIHPGHGAWTRAVASMAAQPEAVGTHSRFDVMQQELPNNLLDHATPLKSDDMNGAPPLQLVPDQLEDERRQLASVIEATEVATYEYHIPTGAVLVNECWAEMIGYALAELEPVSINRFTDFLHPQDRVLVEDSLNRHFSGETRDYECEVRLRHKSGHWVWVLTRGRVMDWSESGEPLRMFGVHLNIQKRKKQEEALRRMRTLLESTGRLGNIGGWQLDLQTDRLTWTDQTKHIHGVPLDYEPTLEAAIAFYAPEVRDTVGEAVDLAMKTGAPWHLEVPLVRADGARIWVHAQGYAEFEDGAPVRLLGVFQDITERRDLLQSISDSKDLMHTTLASIGDGVATTDDQGRLTWLNPVAEQLTGWNNELAKGLAISDVFFCIDESSRQPLSQSIDPCLTEERTTTLSSGAILISQDGQERAVEGSASPICNESGGLLGAVLVFRDVTQERERTGEMRYRASHDSLTGLTNRVEFESRLQELMGNFDSDCTEHGVLFIDLDQFKVVNDTCGHSAGDELLKKLASVLKGAVRGGDTIARLGGDEFGIILERCPKDHSLRIAEKICQNVRDFRFVQGKQRFRIGASIGLVQVNNRWSDIATVLQAADTACYAAKAAGRDRIHLYEASDQAIVEQRSETQWVRRIEEALDADRFVLHFQPIVAAGSAAGSEVTKIELLLRMLDGNNELVFPGAFLPVAERYDLSVRIDLWVLARALELLALSDLDDCVFFINFSARSVSDPRFQDSVKARLKRLSPADRRRLVFEITETTMISNLIEAKEFLTTVRAFGSAIALDDFGSGMASFAYLRSLPIDYLKIDGQFVSSMLEDELALVAIRSFVDVASVLKIPTIAEHVENEQIATKLKTMGVDYMQGFHLGRPAQRSPSK
ncbi:MAG: EAL domain-containing protein [Pseudomonadota bacterium]